MRRKSQSRSVAAPPAPLTAEEAVQQAAAEGLTLLRSECTSTGFKGVTFFSGRSKSSYKSKPYQAQVQRGGKTVHLGRFATAEEAALCYAWSPEAQVAAARPLVPPPLTAEEAVRQAEAEGLILLKSDNKSGYKCVSFRSDKRWSKPYQAHVYRGGKSAGLGHCETAEEAALSYARTQEAQEAAAAPPEPPPMTAEEALRQAESEGLTLLRTASSTGFYKGVHFTGALLSTGASKRKPYQARVWRGGKPLSLGYFQTPEEAALHVARPPGAQATAPQPPSSRKRKVNSEEQPPSLHWRLPAPAPADQVVIIQGRFATCLVCCRLECCTCRVLPEFAA